MRSVQPVSTAGQLRAGGCGLRSACAGVRCCGQVRGGQGAAPPPPISSTPPARGAQRWSSSRGAPRSTPSGCLLGRRLPSSRGARAEAWTQSLGLRAGLLRPRTPPRRPSPATPRQVPAPPVRRLPKSSRAEARAGGSSESLPRRTQAPPPGAGRRRVPAGPCSALSPRDDVRTRGGAAVAEATAEQSARSCALLASRGRHVAATDKVSAPGPAPSALPCAGELGAGCLRAFHVSLVCETFLVRELASFQEPMVLNTLPFTVT